MVFVFQSSLIIEEKEEKSEEKSKPRNAVFFFFLLSPKSTVLSQFCLGTWLFAPMWTKHEFWRYLWNSCSWMDSSRTKQTSKGTWFMGNLTFTLHLHSSRQHVWHDTSHFPCFFLEYKGCFHSIYWNKCFKPFLTSYKKVPSDNK